MRGRVSGEGTGAVSKAAMSIERMYSYLSLTCDHGLKYGEELTRTANNEIITYTIESVDTESMQR